MQRAVISLVMLFALWLCVREARAHDPLDCSSRLMVQADQIEIAVTLGMDGAQHLLANAGFSPDQISEKLKPRGPHGGFDLPATLAPRFFEVNCGTNKLTAKSVTGLSAGMEVLFTLRYPRPTAGSLYVRATVYDGIENLRRSSFVAYDERMKQLVAVSLSRAKADARVPLPTAAPPKSVVATQPGAKTMPFAAYLAAYMTGSDERHLYYAISTNGFRFDLLVNGGRPILTATMDDKLVRDPMLFHDQQGVYHMVATVSWKHRPFTIWDSTNLVHWTSERLVDVAPEGATKTWAPELAYDRANDQYFVYWTAEVTNHWNTAAIYYATTKDFKTFSQPAVLYREPTAGILDANIVYDQGTYHLIYRFKGIWEVTSTNALGPYANARQISPENVEGPHVFPLNDATGWGIVWDYYGGSKGWGLFTSPDLKTWRRITNEKAPFYNDQVWFPRGIRHGSVTPLTQEQLDTIVRELGVTPAGTN